MSSKKVRANRANAAKSTGPRTARGKAVAKVNAVSHGLRSSNVLLPGERPAEWEGFRTAVAASLAPAGAVEGELTDRAAQLMWRLRRVTAFEAGTASLAADHKGLAAERDALARSEAATTRLRRLSSLPDDRKIGGREAIDLLADVAARLPGGEGLSIDVQDPELLTDLGVPAEWVDHPTGWDGWTIGRVRSGVELLAADGEGREGDKADDGAGGGGSGPEETPGLKLIRRVFIRVVGEFCAGRDRVAELEAAARIVVVPATDALDRLQRYEGHLGRQLVQTLTLLKLLQSARVGPG